MTGNPISVVLLSLPADDEAQFGDFYQHQFLPSIAEHNSFVVGISRYEEFGIDGSLRWNRKKFLTIYELAEGVTPEQFDGVFADNRIAEEMKKFKQWKLKFNDFDRSFFQEIYRAHRNASESFTENPFFLHSFEAPADKEESHLRQWYQTQFLPRNLSDVPLWRSCRRYASVGRQKSMFHTAYGAADESSLTRALQLMRAPRRYSENSAWEKQSEGIIGWQDATSYRPIFLWKR